MRHFYDTIRPIFPAQRISQLQFEGIERLLKATAKYPVEFRAYIMATVFHETGGSMLPNTENLNYTSAKRIVEVWPKRFKSVEEAQKYVRQPAKLAEVVYGGRLGNDKPGDGWRYRGRGLPHLTGKINYAKGGMLVGRDLVGDPELALNPDIAMKILIDGMTTGWYTGKKLADFQSPTGFNYTKARAVVNPDNRGELIAVYARRFEAGLKLAEETAVPVTYKDEVKTDPSFVALFIEFLKRLFGSKK